MSYIEWNETRECDDCNERDRCPEYTLDGECEVVQRVPAAHEVCSRCQGEGQHTNPSIDGDGITQSEMAELGEDFQRDYMSGVYDVTCSECHGRRVVLVALDPPDGAGPEHLLVRYQRHLERQAEWDREDRTTLYWESGGAMGSRY